MRVIIERDPGESGRIAAEKLSDAIVNLPPLGVPHCLEVTIVDRAVPQALIADRPDLDYESEVRKR